MRNFDIVFRFGVLPVLFVSSASVLIREVGKLFSEIRKELKW